MNKLKSLAQNKIFMIAAAGVLVIGIGITCICLLTGGKPVATTPPPSATDISKSNDAAPPDNADNSASGSKNGNASTTRTELSEDQANADPEVKEPSVIDQDTVDGPAKSPSQKAPAENSGSTKTTKKVPPKDTGDKVSPGGSNNKVDVPAKDPESGGNKKPAGDNPFAGGGDTIINETPGDELIEDGWGAAGDGTKF